MRHWRSAGHHNLRAALTIGFIGGLTTYSSFNYETMRLFEEGAPASAAMNVAADDARRSDGRLAGSFGGARGHRALKEGCSHART